MTDLVGPELTLPEGMAAEALKQRDTLRGVLLILKESYNPEGLTHNIKEKYTQAITDTESVIESLTQVGQAHILAASQHGKTVLFTSGKTLRRISDYLLTMDELTRKSNY